MELIIANSKSDSLKACLSMIQGKHIWTDELYDPYKHWKEYLSAHGYAIQEVSFDYHPTHELIENWPLRPWAPLHLLETSVDSYSLMLEDGIILDPCDVSIKHRNQYKRIFTMYGLWKVSEPLDFLNPQNNTAILRVRTVSD